MFRKRKDANSKSKEKNQQNQGMPSKIVTKSVQNENSEEMPGKFYTITNNERSNDNSGSFSPYNNYVNRSNMIKKQAQENQSPGTNKRNLSYNMNNHHVNISALMQDRILTPKSNFKFQTYTNSVNKNTRNVSKTTKNRESSNKAFSNVKKTPSTEKIKYNNLLNNDKSYNNLNNSKGSIGGYLEMRHSETIEKINKMKYDKLVQETKELRNRPHISKNSQVIIEKLVENRPNNVFDRLSTKHPVKLHFLLQGKKKQNEDEYFTDQENTQKPKINETSQKMQRTIDDLYYWQKCLDDKLEIHKSNFVCSVFN